MQMSARILGQDYGVTGEEMNRILVKLGFLKGQPGNYDLTEKGLKYAIEKSFHRGTGGYSQYNRYWTTKTFDDSIRNVLEVSPKLIDEVRKELSAERAARYAAQALARKQANADFLAKEATKKATMEATEKVMLLDKEFIAKCKKTGTIGLITIGIITTGYGIYKLTPKIKDWWKSRNDIVKKKHRHQRK